MSGEIFDYHVLKERIDFNGIYWLCARGSCKKKKKILVTHKCALHNNDQAVQNLSDAKVKKTYYRQECWNSCKIVQGRLSF